MRASWWSKQSFRADTWLPVAWACQANRPTSTLVDWTVRAIHPSNPPMTVRRMPSRTPVSHFQLGPPFLLTPLSTFSLLAALAGELSELLLAYLGAGRLPSALPPEFGAHEAALFFGRRGHLFGAFDVRVDENWRGARYVELATITAEGIEQAVSADRRCLTCTASQEARCDLAEDRRCFTYVLPSR